MKNGLVRGFLTAGLSLPALTALLSLTAALGVFLFPACRFADEILHMSPPELVSWQPGTGSADPENLESLELHFSASMNRNLTEQAFSLSEDGEVLEGVFSWEKASSLGFTPGRGFIPHRLYEIRVTGDAEDRWGNSLEREWCARFRTGEDDTPPRVLAVSPEDYSLITDPRQSIRYRFSEPVDRQSFREALSVSPELLCVQDWEDGSRAVILIPAEDFREGEEYGFTLGTGLSDLAGHTLREPCRRNYPVADPGEPVLEELSRRSDGRVLSSEILNGGLEKDTVLRGRMNRSLTAAERAGLISLSPDAGFDMDWTAAGDEFSLSFSDPPAWESCRSLRVGDEVFLLCFDGPGSRPPGILGLHFCADSKNPGAHEPRELRLNGALGACDSENAFLDIRIALAEGAQPNRASLLESLSISSAVLTVQGRSCEEYYPGLLPPPALLPSPGESLCRIYLTIQTTGLPGTVTIALDDSFRDSLENRMGSRYALTVCQP